MMEVYQQMIFIQLWLLWKAIYLLIFLGKIWLQLLVEGVVHIRLAFYKTSILWIFCQFSPFLLINISSYL